jgi:hypothetical protein
MTDAEREAHIAACGRHMLAAAAAGDTVTARHWLDDMVAAVKQRSPVQVAAMESCYFAAEGERARLAARAGATPS